jgi:hypothetical protein
MTLSLSKLRPTAISFGLVTLLMLALVYTPDFDAPADIVVREIAVGMPPPPPPPPPAESRDQQASLPIDVSPGTKGLVPELRADSIVLNVAEPKVKAPAVEREALRPDLKLDIAWDGFALNELDDVPRLLSKPVATFPNSLKRRNVRKVRVKLLVTIDEKGKVLLRDVVYSSHAEINSQLPALAQRSRFTAPKKDGQPVRARFVWPLVLQSDG